MDGFSKPQSGKDDDTWGKLASDLFGIDFGVDDDLELPDPDQSTRPEAVAETSASPVEDEKNSSVLAASAPAGESAAVGDFAGEKAEVVPPAEAKPAEHDDFWDILDSWNWDEPEAPPKAGAARAGGDRGGSRSTERAHSAEDAPRAERLEEAPSEPPRERSDDSRRRPERSRSGDRGPRRSEGGRAEGSRSEVRGEGRSEVRGEGRSEARSPEAPRSETRREERPAREGDRERRPRSGGRGRPEPREERRPVARKPVADEFGEGVENESRPIEDPEDFQWEESVPDQPRSAERKPREEAPVAKRQEEPRRPARVRKPRPKVDPDDFAGDLFVEEDEFEDDELELIEEGTGAAEEPREAAGEAEDDEAPRRRRRRRRRGGSRSSATRPASEGESAEGDEASDEEASEDGGETNLDDDEAPRRRRRRRRRRPGTAASTGPAREESLVTSRASSSDEDEDEDDEEDDDDEVVAEYERPAPTPKVVTRYDDVPTWEEAIAYMVHPRDRETGGGGHDHGGPRHGGGRPRGRGRGR